MTEKNGLDERCVKVSKVMYIGAILILGLMFNVQFLAGMVDIPSETALYDGALGRNFFGLSEGISGSQEQEFYGNTPVPAHDALEIHASDRAEFWYKAVSPYYKVYFKGNTVRMYIQDRWIEYELGHVEAVVQEQEGCQLSIEEPIIPCIADSVVNQNTLDVSNVFESVDVSYKVDTSVLTEEMVLKEPKQITRIIQKIEWEGIVPEYQDDGSILFLDENEEKIVQLLAPYMEDASHNVCKDLHYEIIETESGYELHKVINEKGLQWLKNAVYPVVLDPSMQTFEDAWESSGLTPYGQYFKNLKEHVNPANGLLTITQTDLTIPGRGLDLEISRVYNTPAIFYGLNPYDYEAPPIDVGKGWQLNFPWIGSKYLHLFNGSVYKIEWNDDTFVNHTGVHFVLVKNGDSTYTLTLADGKKYYFNAQGNITSIEDVYQNSIQFTYDNGVLTTITDTVGRVVTLNYDNDKLQKIMYNSHEIEYSYNNECLEWTEDFLNRRTSYYYNTGYNTWLLSKIEYPPGGYATYQYNRFSDSGYYRYHVTHQKVYDTILVRHNAFSYTGSFEEITKSVTSRYDEYDQIQSKYIIDFNNGLVQWITITDSQDTEIIKVYLEYNSKKEMIQKDTYAGGSQTVSYSDYFKYDSWGNLIYVKDASGHESFYSYGNTDSTGYFVDYTGNIVTEFTNGFIASSVPSHVHTYLLGTAERQGNGNMTEVYYEYTGPDRTESRSVYAPQTTWLTYSGTFDEYTGDTSFPIDLTGHTVVGNGVLKVTGKSSTPTYQESRSYTPDYQCRFADATWNCYGWVGGYYKVQYVYCCGSWPDPVDCYDGNVSIGYFTHRPGTLGYQSYSTNPSCDQKAHTFSVTTNWKAYPAQVEYNIDNSDWTTISSNLKDTTTNIAVPGLTTGENTLYFTESSSKQTKFSWVLYVPVDTISNTYTTAYTYDPYGNMISQINPQGHTTTYEYSSEYNHAYLTSKTDIVSGQDITVSAVYDFNLGVITSKTCACGSVTDYEYDILGRRTKIIHPLVSGEQTRAEYEIIYDDINNTATLFNENDEKTIRYYDGLNRMVKEEVYTDVLWAVTEYVYNYIDKPKQMTDPLSRVYQFEYDALGRIVKFYNPDQTYRTLQYDNLNNMIIFTDENQHTKEYTLDWIGNIESVEEYNGQTSYVTQYQYDELGNLTQMTDPEQKVYTYEYNSLFGITKAVYPDMTEQEFSYDSVGNLIQKIDQNGTTINYTYDAVSRLTEINYQDATISFTYNQLGQKTFMVTPDVTNYYQYDERNRLTELEYVIDSTSYVIQYTYDPVGNITEIRYPDNSTVQYTYFLKDLLEDIQGIATFSYCADGKLVQSIFSNGVTTDYGYNTTGRIDNIHAYTEQNLLDVSYIYDAAGNITQIQNNYSTASEEWITSTESYTYDDLNRLVSASNGFGTLSYEYDSKKRLSVDDNGQVIHYTYDYDKLLSAGSTTFTYDSNGNTLTKSADHEWVYHYNNANQLIQVDKDQQMVAQYVYNGDGKRIKKIEWSDTLQDYETTISIYSGEHIVYEENDTGTARHIYGPTGRIAKQTTINNETTTYYYSTDYLGSTRMVTSDNGTPLTSVTYYPFGTLNNYTGSEQSFLFTGKEKDATGLYYFNARYYNPETGRFITRDLYTWLPDDPRSSGTSETMKKWLINPQRFDRYSYALNNPLRYTDPTGLSTLVCCDPNCNQLCEDDDAQNSNPGGTEGSPQYSTDPPEEDPEEETDEDPEEETDEEKRKRLQKECIEECKEDKEVVKLFNEIKALKNKRLAAGVFGVAGCGILGALTFGTVALACGIAFFYSTLDSGWSIDRYEKEIRKKGCSCVLGEDEL